MKVKFTSKEERLKIISASILAGTFLVSGCSNSFNKNNGDKTVQTGDLTTIETNVSDSTEFFPETSETTEKLKKYDIMWGDTASKDFSNYVLSKTGVDLGTYVRFFGFTDDLNIIYSEYMEKNYGTEGRVSFETSNYFFSYLDNVGGEGRRVYRDYEFFEIRYFESDNCLHGTFNNKLIMSYLCQNNLQLGYMIPESSFKSISTDYINICKKFDLDYFLNNRSLGSYGSEHVYDVEQVLAGMVIYNNNMGYIYYTESMKDFDIMSKPEAVEIFNQHLKKFYGPNAPQIGQVVTVEQYRAMFGEDPIDLSYIPGAVVQETPVKGDAKVRIDYDNYNVYYTPSPGYDEESSGRGRRM